MGTNKQRYLVFDSCCFMDDKRSLFCTRMGCFISKRVNNNNNFLMNTKQITKIQSYVTDTSSAIFILAFICAWPKHNPLKSDNYVPLMSWKDIEKQFPWRLILLLGGSLAMAEACEVIFYE